MDNQTMNQIMNQTMNQTMNQIVEHVNGETYKTINNFIIKHHDKINLDMMTSQSKDDRFIRDIKNINNNINNNINKISDMKLYEIGDVIEAIIDDFSLLNDRFTHYVKGIIVGIYQKDSLKGYDVKLFKTIYCEQYIPKPLTNEYKDYIQPKINEDMSDLKNIFNPMNLIFINHDNIIRHCPRDKISKMSFLEGLREIWSGLIFRSVKAIIKNSNELTIVEYVKIDENKKIQIETFPNLKEAFSKVPKKYHRNIRGRYKEYYGFTTSNIIRQNDTYEGKEIFFSKKCHSELKLDFDATGRFSKNDIENTWPPRKDQIICGIPEQGEKGLFFRKWFVCSRQFLTLWTMIFYPNHPSLCDEYIVANKSIYKPKSFDRLLMELDTRLLQPNYDQSISEIQDRYRIFNVESCALQSTDKYQIIAKLAFLNEETEKIKKNKLNRLNNPIVPLNSSASLTPVNSHIFRSFQENLYDDILSMIDN